MPNDDIRTPLMELLQQYQQRCGTDLRGAIRDLIAEVAAISREESIDPEEIVQQGLALSVEEAAKGN